MTSPLLSSPVVFNFLFDDICNLFSDRLSAQDILTIKKVQEYVYDKLYEKGEESGKEGRGSHIDILCTEQVSGSHPPWDHPPPHVRGAAGPF